MYISKIIYICFNVSDIEAEVRALQAKRQQTAEVDPESEKVSLVGGAQLDSDIYGKGRFEGYVTSIAANEDLEVSVFFSTL